MDMEKGVSLINMENSIKGLLIKDWKLISSQRQFGVMVILFYLFFTMTQQASFAIGYCTVMLALFTLTTLSYDELDNGAAYLFTMPIVRKDYVREKYLFAFLVTTIPWAAMNVISYTICVIRAEDLELAGYLAGSVATLFVAYFMVAIEMPIQLKYGAEKSRLVIMLTIGVTFILAYILYRIGPDMLSNIAQTLDDLSESGIGAFFAIPAVCIIAVIVISYFISKHIVEHREF